MQAVGVTRIPEDLVQLRNTTLRIVEGFNVYRRRNRSFHQWRGSEGPSESTGRGMHEEIHCRTREAPEVPDCDLILR